jgi:hypothetical protein
MEDCPLCLEGLQGRKRKIHVTACGHSFHGKCFNKVKTNECPCCRGALPPFRVGKLRLDMATAGDEFRILKSDMKMIVKDLNLLKTELNIPLTGRQFKITITENDINRLREIQDQIYDKEEEIDNNRILFHRCKYYLIEERDKRHRGD